MTKNCKVKRQGYKLLICNVISYMMCTCQLRSKDTIFPNGGEKTKPANKKLNYTKTPGQTTTLQSNFHNLNCNLLTNTTFRKPNQWIYTTNYNSRFMYPKDIFLGSYSLQKYVSFPFNLQKLNLNILKFFAACVPNLSMFNQLLKLEQAFYYLGIFFNEHISTAYGLEYIFQKLGQFYKQVIYEICASIFTELDLCYRCSEQQSFGKPP